MIKDDKNVYAVMPHIFAEKLVTAISQALLSMQTDKQSERIRLASFYLTQVLHQILHAESHDFVELHATNAAESSFDKAMDKDES